MLLQNRVNKKELKKRIQEETIKRTTVSFYRYVIIENPQELRDEIFAQWQKLNILGRIYVAHEGINAQMSVPEANFDAYFNAMSNKSIFIGTDASENWNIEAFKNFSKPHFDKGKAWDFKVIDRTWVFSKNKNIAWFDENLGTWMKDCRGSGIMVKEKGKWKLAYYNLTVLIENEKIQEFISLRGD